MLFENSERDQDTRSVNTQKIALVDCNNFYASCERVFNPAWQHRPLAVLSNNDGCIIARSNEIKAAGIPMGAPYFKFKKQLQAINAIVVSSNYSLYGDMSARVMSTLAAYTPDMEIYSIDEAWLNLTGFNADNLTDYGRRIIQETRQYTGIPVSIGIGSTKVLAKLANRVCKRSMQQDQVLDLSALNSHELDGILDSVDIGDVWGIGKRLSESLRKNHKLHTALDLKNSDPYQMRRYYSVVVQRLILELQGITCLTLEDITAKKQIIASRSFGEKVTSLSQLEEAVSTHTARACEKLRSQSSVTNAISVSIRNSPFRESEPFFSQHGSIRFATPTADTSQVISGALSVLKQIYKKGPKYAKAGIMLFDIQPATQVQLDFFQQEESSERKKLMSTIDAINHRYGKNTLFFGSQGIQQHWAMKRQLMTPRFTTSWQDLPQV